MPSRLIAASVPLGTAPARPGKLENCTARGSAPALFPSLVDCLIRIVGVLVGWFQALFCLLYSGGTSYYRCTRSAGDSASCCSTSARRILHAERAPKVWPCSTRHADSSSNRAAPFAFVSHENVFLQFAWRIGNQNPNLLSYVPKETKRDDDRDSPDYNFDHNNHGYWRGCGHRTSPIARMLSPRGSL